MRDGVGVLHAQYPPRAVTLSGISLSLFASLGPGLRCCSRTDVSIAAAFVSFSHYSWLDTTYYDGEPFYSLGWLYPTNP